MTETIFMLLTVAAIVAAVFAGIYWLLPKAMRRGYDVAQLIETADTVQTTADALVGGLQALFPDNPALTLIDRVVDYAGKSVDAIEQMYRTAQLEAEERKDAARKLVYDMLTVSGIEVKPDDDKLRRVIDGAIEAAVYLTPHEDVEPEPEDTDVGDEDEDDQI